MKRLDMRGITLLELLVVIAICGILTGMAGYTVEGLHDRIEAERQIQEMYGDMMNARVQAVQGRRMYFVVVTADNYQIVEDTNDSGGTAPDRGDTALWSVPKQFDVPSQWSGTIIMKGNGIMAKSTGPLQVDDALDIPFDAAGVKPEYDCISVGPTRISEGKWNGRQCAEG